MNLGLHPRYPLVRAHGTCLEPVPLQSAICPRNVVRRSRGLAEKAMNYDQIDVLDRGTLWQGGAVDAAIDSPPLGSPGVDAPSQDTCSLLVLSERATDR